MPPQEVDEDPDPVAGGVREDADEGSKDGGNAVIAQLLETERIFWAFIEGSRNPAKFRAYLKKYGENGEFAELARIELEELEGGGGAAAAVGEGWRRQTCPGGGFGIARGVGVRSWWWCLGGASRWGVRLERKDGTTTRVRCMG